MLDDVVEIIRPKLTAYQLAIINSPARFTVTTAATKIGKTFSHLWWLFEESHSPPKKGANYWWVAPVYSQAKIAFTRLKRVVENTGAYRINESELYIITPLGSVIWFKSADKADNLYGEDVFAVVFDEFTRAKEAAWIALRSTLTATKGKCKFIGNAKGRKNWGYKLALKAKSGEPNYEFFKITAYDAVNEGILSLEEIEQAKRDLPKHAFDELYLAEELEDQANPFGISFIRTCIKPISTKPSIVYGIDLAKSVDWTVVVGLDSQGMVSFFDRWQSDWSQTRRRIVSIIGNVPALIDSTGVGDPIVEDIQKQCWQAHGFHYTSNSKQQIMEGLATAIQNGYISVLSGVMQDELESFEFVYSKSGVKYNAPDGLHDDITNALALARKRYLDRPTAPTLTFHK